MKPDDPTRLRRTLLAFGMAGAASAALTASAHAAPSAGSTQLSTFKRAASEVRVSSSRLDVPAGGTATVSGHVDATGPQLVRLQRYARGRWITLDKDVPNARGRFKLEHRDDTPGTQMVRVRYSGDARNAPDSEVVGRLNTFAEVGASWYGPGFYGNTTACGQTFSAGVMGVAHKTLPCGTTVILRNGSRTVKAKVIDRGPYVGGRALDLSPAVKHALRFGDTGTVGLAF